VDERAGIGSTEKNKQRLVLRKAEEFAQVWKLTQAGLNPPAETPKVDFRKHMVLAVFSGERNSGGYAITITKAVKTGKDLRVHVKETFPAPGTIVDTVITHPFHFVVVPAIKGKVTFVED